MSLRSRIVLGLLLLVSIAADARVLSYAPYSDRPSIPAIQKRANRHFVLMESTSTWAPPFLMSPVPMIFGIQGQLVVYDSQGKEEPRVILPVGGVGDANILAAAVWEDGSGALKILAETNASIPGDASNAPRYLFSGDGGTTWSSFALPVVTWMPTADTGGPVARAKYAPIRIGSAEYPFLIAIPNTGTLGAPAGLYAVDASGNPAAIVTKNTAQRVELVGTDLVGQLALLRMDDKILQVDIGRKTSVARLDADPAAVYDGWIGADYLAYVEGTKNGTQRTLYTINSYQSPASVRAIGPYQVDDSHNFVIAPNADYASGWYSVVSPGQPTTLAYTFQGATFPQWSDITGPQVEALYPGNGPHVLIQVHRPRQQADQRLFKDPALAIWTSGDPAPTSYDELFLDERLTKGFVHLDVEAVVGGGNFVFDSGADFGMGGGGVIISPAPSGGGTDVVQEWGVVRASLQQRLVIPAIARLGGAYGSFWKTDLTFYNPGNDAVDLDLRYVATGSAITTTALNTKSLAIAPHSIQFIPDALQALFAIDEGGGSLFVTPAPGQAISATSRTYSTSSAGTYGMTINAVETTNTTSPRFPVTFSGAFPGSGFRTNFLVTDVSGRGSSIGLSAFGSSGAMGSDNVALSAPAGTLLQYNGIGTNLGLLPSDAGALAVKPQSGEAIVSVVAIDNKTNDPTYFPPDLPATTVRTIPAIGHIDGANGSRFRSDLYLYNVSSDLQTVTFQVSMWDGTAAGTINFTMLPHEGRVIRDVLSTMFGRTGIARLRYQSGNTMTASGVRATSRTYTIDENGGTYGFLMPPLNEFQSAGIGDTLEIFGAFGGQNFRTNLGLVDLTAFPSGGPVRVHVEVYDQALAKIDSFDVNVPSAGGMQINDLFHARNLGDGPAAGLIRITPFGGMIGAYAASVDNGTNDPTYIPAGLAAH